MKLAFDAMDRKSMLALAEHYDPDIPSYENEIYAAKVREMADTWEVELVDQIKEILKEPAA
jgi:CPA2 family monovalent cation:H+ antiporter-2